MSSLRDALHGPPKPSQAERLAGAAHPSAFVVRCVRGCVVGIAQVAGVEQRLCSARDSGGRETCATRNVGPRDRPGRQHGSEDRCLCRRSLNRPAPLDDHGAIVPGKLACVKYLTLSPARTLGARCIRCGPVVVTRVLPHPAPARTSVIAPRTPASSSACNRSRRIRTRGSGGAGVTPPTSPCSRMVRSRPSAM